MTERLLAAGYQVHVFNRSRSAVDRLVALGAHGAESSADVAERAAIVLTALPTPTDVEAVYLEVSTKARPGQLYIDHSTVSMELNRLCADQLRARHADFLDAPVSGGPAGATGGTLTVMVGGNQESFDRALPVLQAFGTNICLCGPLGSGQVVKHVNQLLVGIHTAAIAEATVLGVKLGADPNVLLSLISQSFGGSAMLSRNVPRFISRDFSPATPISLILKDLSLIAGEAATEHTPIPLGILARSRFATAQSRGLADQDIAAVVQLWEDDAEVVVGRPA
jgi:3-hydroxyisobutyrate dehydrogenase/2-hydroxy-3-oxopropionate reductase